MTKLLIVLIFAAAVTAVYLALRKPPVLDAEGKESPYRKGGFFDQGVYFTRYVGDGLMGSKHLLKIPNADKDTFEVVTITMPMAPPENGTLKLGKAAGRYFLGDLLLPFDPDTEPLLRANRDRSAGPILYITKKRVFFLRHDSLVEIPGADPDTFWILETPTSVYRSNYAKDENTVFYFAESYEPGPGFLAINGADAKTFEHLKSDYGKDKSNNYHKEKIDTAGPIVKLDETYSKNDLLAFYGDLPIAGADAKTFESIGHGFFRDQTQLFYDGRAVPGIDPATFRNLTQQRTNVSRDVTYIRDKNHIYFATGFNGTFAPVPGADLDSFEHLRHSFGTDKLNVYFEGKQLKDIEREGFEVLFNDYPMGLYVKNHRHVYILDKDRLLRAVPKADPKSFAIYDSKAIQVGGPDAEDEKHFFYNGEVVKNKK